MIKKIFVSLLLTCTILSNIQATYAGMNVSAQPLPHGFPETNRTKIKLNQGWKFHLGQPEAEYFKKKTDDSQWQTVNVPHTLELTSLALDEVDDPKTQPTFHRKVGWYRKEITVSERSKKVFLEFEGAHQVTNLWVNGKHVGEHAVSGYTPFHFDITRYVKRKKPNQITLLVDNRRSEVISPDPGPFDYIKFSGLYRDLYLVETDPVHVTFNWESANSGVTITTPTIDPVNKNATVNIKTSVKNEGKKAVQAKLVTRIIDNDGVVVLKLENQEKIYPEQEKQFNQIGSLEDNVRLWGIDDPYLYRVNSVVVVDDKPVDFVENKLGLRSFSLDPTRGFVLNGKAIELVGFNRHQQYPFVGDAVPDALHYKDMLQFKEFGFNVMRTAHYPQDDALIDACDELGILVYEEAPTWIGMPQNEKWWDNLEQAARIMIRNHRNHPSIVIWGGGLNHRGYVPRIHNAAKQEDPTRLTASQGATWTGWQASGLTDINANMLYGAFLWDRTEPLFAMEGRSGPQALAPHKKDPLMAGLISWTAHAYYTFHPRHRKAKSKLDRTRSGAMTIFRYPRPPLHWYKAELLDEPFVSIANDWVDGTEEITVYSNAKETELFINGQSVARISPSKDKKYDGLDHPPFYFNDLKYKEGQIEVKAYFDDNEVLSVSKSTPSEPYAIELTLDSHGRDLTADGSDILLAYARVVDKNGSTVSKNTPDIHFSVEGDGSIVGDKSTINSNPMFTEYGVAPALIRAGTSAKTITVHAKAEGLIYAKKQIKLVPYNANVIADNAKPIYDFAKERVDLGAPDQLVQFGWHAWNGANDTSNTYRFKNFDDAQVTIGKPSGKTNQYWLGEMNVIGKYAFAYGDGIFSIADKGINFSFEKLPKGDYQLRTWHHAPRSNSDSMDPNKEKLKALNFDALSHEAAIVVSTDSAIAERKVEVKVTEGKQMQWQAPSTSVIRFRSDGINPVVVNYNGKGPNGIWVNAIELSDWANTGTSN